MTTISDTDAAASFAALLDKADVDGEVRIKRANGKEFVLRRAGRSPLDVGFVEVHPSLTADEIVQAVRDGRDRD